jgi:hypothetical protein
MGLDGIRQPGEDDTFLSPAGLDHAPYSSLKAGNN